MTHLDYLNKNFPVRKTEQEKEDFRNYVLDMLAKKGINAKVEKTADGKNNNLIVGDPTAAKAVFTAHYDTPAASLFPNVMIPKNSLLFYTYQFVPVIFLLAISLTISYLLGIVLFNDEKIYMISFLALYYGIFFLMFKVFKNKNNYNDNTSGVATVLTMIDGLSSEELSEVAFILFDNEEKGKKGSAAYFKDHKDAMKDKPLINFDCVGNGDNIIFIAQKDAVNSKEYELLKSSFEKDRNFNLDFTTHKEASSNSDHKNFPKGIACVACKKLKNGLLYTPYIHTSEDVVVNNENINYIAQNSLRFVKNIYQFV